MNLIDAIKSTEGKIFSATFVKKDGTIRDMVARTEVQKNLTGKGLAYNPLDRGLVVVYDMRKEAYRMINTKTLRSLKCGALEWHKDG